MRVAGVGAHGAASARITMWTTMMLDFEGANAVLFCRAEGHPRPTIEGDPRTNEADAGPTNDSHPRPTVTWFDPEDQHIDVEQQQQYIVRSCSTRAAA